MKIVRSVLYFALVYGGPDCSTFSSMVVVHPCAMCMTRLRSVAPSVSLMASIFLCHCAKFEVNVRVYEELD